MTDWRTSFPGAAAARHMREWLDWQIEQLEAGCVDEVRGHLPGRQWASDFDMSGMPTITMDHIGVLMLDAWNALTPPYRVDDAIADLRRARELVTPSRQT